MSAGVPDTSENLLTKIPLPASVMNPSKAERLSLNQRECCHEREDSNSVGKTSTLGFLHFGREICFMCGQAAENQTGLYYILHHTQTAQSLN